MVHALDRQSTLKRLDTVNEYSAFVIGGLQSENCSKVLAYARFQSIHTVHMGGYADAATKVRAPSNYGALQRQKSAFSAR